MNITPRSAPPTRTVVSPPLAYGIVPPGYRLPPTTTLGRVVLQIADLSTALPFYEQVLGLRALHGPAIA